MYVFLHVCVVCTVLESGVQLWHFGYINAKIANFRAHVEVLAFFRSCPQLPSVVTSRGRQRGREEVALCLFSRLHGLSPCGVAGRNSSDRTFSSHSSLLCWHLALLERRAADGASVGGEKDWFSQVEYEQEANSSQKEILWGKKGNTFVFSASSIWKTAHFEGKGNIGSKKPCWVEWSSARVWWGHIFLPLELHHLLFFLQALLKQSVLSYASAPSLFSYLSLWATDCQEPRECSRELL